MRVVVSRLLCFPHEGNDTVIRHEGCEARAGRRWAGNDHAGQGPLRPHAIPTHRSQRAQAARGVPWALAELRGRAPDRDATGHHPPRLRSRHHALRPGEQLWAAVRLCRGELRRTKDAAAILRQLGTPLLIHQPSYSMLNRWIEPDLLKVLGDEGIGCIVFSPLAQGLLTDRYLAGVPAGSRASHPGSFSADLLTEQLLAKVRALNQIAIRRGQTLAQMALAWTLRDPRVTSTLIGASSVAQLEQNVGALDQLQFSAEELKDIDRYATESGINLWAASSAG